jgi:hypothetical protein
LVVEVEAEAGVLEVEEGVVGVEEEEVTEEDVEDQLINQVRERLQYNQHQVIQEKLK